MPQTVELDRLFAEQGLPHEPRQARSRARLRAIFAAAAALFEEQGYGGATMTSIAERAGMSVGTLYFYFRDKRQILLTMLATKLREYPRLGTVDPEALLRDARAYLHAELRAAYPYSRVYYSLSRAVGELAFQDEPFRRLSDEIVAVVQDQLRQIILLGRNAGLTHADLDVDETAHTLALVVYGFYSLVPNPSQVSEEAFNRSHRAAADMVYRAIFAAPAGRGGRVL
jgi:AcrR family transcriptional regulator